MFSIIFLSTKRINLHSLTTTCIIITKKRYFSIISKTNHYDLSSLVKVPSLQLRIFHCTNGNDTIYYLSFQNWWHTKSRYVCVYTKIIFKSFSARKKSWKSNQNISLLSLYIRMWKEWRKKNISKTSASHIFYDSSGCLHFFCYFFSLPTLYNSLEFFFLLRFNEKILFFLAGFLSFYQFIFIYHMT